MQNLIPHFILEKHVQGESSGSLAAVSMFADLSGFSALTNALIQHGSEAAETVADVTQAIFDPVLEQVRMHGGLVTGFAGDGFTALFPKTWFETEAAAYEHALAAAVGIQQHVITNPTQTTPYGRFAFTVKLGLADGQAEWGILRPAPPAGSAQGPEGSEVKAAYFFSGPAIDAAAAAEHHAASGNLILSPGVADMVRPLVRTIPVGDAGAPHYRLLTIEGQLPGPQPTDWASPHAVHMEAFIPNTICRLKTRGEFRQTVSVFVNLMGVETAEEVAIFVRSVFELQGQFGGYLNRIDFGDKGCNMLMFWGSPVSHEDDLERALGFILSIRDHTPRTYKAGITYRPMYTGLSGSLSRGEFTAYGDGVNLAARLMVAAPWGSIWVDEQVASRAQRAFVFQDAGEHNFKGFTGKLPVHALLERKQKGLEEIFQGVLVGRQAEIERLEAFAHPLFAPAGQKRMAGIIVVQGEAGMGKSRLIWEFKRKLERSQPNRPPQWFLCQTDQTIRQPLNPFRYWLHSYFEQAAAQSETRNKQTFSRKLDRLVASTPDPELQKEINRTRSLLGAMVSLYWDNSLYAQLSPSERLDNILRALKTLVKAESLRQPVILFIEDAQWFDDGSIEFIQYLRREVDEYPFAIVATARPERQGILFGPQQSYEEIALPTLSNEELELLAADRLGGRASPNLAALLVERAEGNPFLAEQILLYLRERGAIALKGDVWHVTGAKNRALPANVGTIFTARLDNLAHEVKEIVQMAAVLGREFEVQVLSQMLGNDNMALTDKVSSAESEIWDALGQMRYLFKHALLRDAAYEMQLRARRRQLHLQAGEAMETLYADNLPPHYRELAYHYEAAYQQGQTEAHAKALHYLYEAGKRAANKCENRVAADYFSRALTLVPEADTDKRYELLLAREQLYDTMGEREAQEEDLHALAELVEALKVPQKRALVSLRQARYARDTADYAQVVAAARATISAAQVARETRYEVEGLVVWGDALRYQGEYNTARSRLTEALELAHAVGDREGEALALRALGNTLAHEGQCAEAATHFQQALAIYRELGDRQGESHALDNLGSAAAATGNYAEAQACYEQSLAIDSELGRRQGQAVSLSGLGVVSNSLGEYDRARNYYEQALHVQRDVDDQQGEAATCRDLGSTLQSLGQHEAAQAHYERARSICSQIGDREGEGEALLGLGTILHAQGEHAEAQTFYEQALDIGQQLRDRDLHAAASNALGAVYQTVGTYDRAETYFQQALATRRELSQAHYAVEDLAGLAQVLLARGEMAQAQAYVDEILSYLQSNPKLNGTRHRTRTFLTVYQVLQALGDPQTIEFLGSANALLQERAAKIADEALRRSFLENDPERRQIVHEMACLARGQAEPPERTAETEPVSTAALSGPTPARPEERPEAQTVEAAPPAVVEQTSGRAAATEPPAALPDLRSTARDTPIVEQAIEQTVEQAVEQAVEPLSTVPGTRIDPAALEQILEAVAAAAGAHGVTLIVQGNVYFSGGLSLGSAVAGRKARSSRKKKRGNSDAGPLATG